MTKNTKIIILAIVTILSSVMAWHSLTTVFQLELGGGSFSIIKIILSFVYPVLAFCFFLALVSLSAILIRNEWILIAIWVVVSLPVFLFFPFSPWLLIISLLLVIVFLYYSVRIKGEMNSRVKFSLSKILRWGLGLTVLGIILSISLIYYITTTIEQRDTGKEAIDGLVESSVKIANQIIPTQFKNYNPDMTLDEFVFQISAGVAENIGGELNKEIQSSFGNPYEENADVLVEELRKKVESGEIEESLLPPEIRDNLYSGTLTTEELVSSAQIQSLFQEQINQSRDELLKNLDIEATGDDKMSDVLAKIIRKYAFQFLGPYEKFITPLLALSLFFALSIFNFLFQAIIKLVAVIVFNIMRVTSFLQIKEEKKNVQQVTLE